MSEPDTAIPMGSLNPVRSDARVPFPQGEALASWAGPAIAAPAPVTVDRTTRKVAMPTLSLAHVHPRRSGFCTVPPFARCRHQTRKLANFAPQLDRQIDGTRDHSPSPIGRSASIAPARLVW